MKRIACIIFFWGLSGIVWAQNCTDALLIKNNEQIDTLFCRIMDEDEQSYTIDNGVFITSISKNAAISKILCIREMTIKETMHYKSLDAIAFSEFPNTKTAGYYLRKASLNTGIATGLLITGGGVMTLGLTIFKDRKSQPFWVIGGGLLTATSVFFFIRAWNQIYKAGKLLDVGNNAALYLNVTDEGLMGLSLKF
ncbi:MAG: hypothetical protein LBK03_04125 [Bacteroidales bacterium]|jgi:hypothetical protein|nr:hypothetical protein [Bacteroidales bacterium]